ncbi:hypothetical protein DVH26_18985 [Paenibacillus sp. H1-7]|nr:hypothetical protein DVH26_18985 [Paenibacillus sp. H1-7]
MIPPCRASLDCTGCCPLCSSVCPSRTAGGCTRARALPNLSETAALCRISSTVPFWTHTCHGLAGLAGMCSTGCSTGSAFR